jgi:putative tryptophan/tyrosine transport system substrate-binding protein
MVPRADFGHHAEAFLKGLKESGFTEGENTTIEYRWAEGRYERLSQHAEELVRLRVAVIAVGSPPAAFAAKSATSTIPIVFITADDPVKDGLVTSFNRPGGNLTGVTVFTTAAMWNKRLELVHDLMPKAASAAILINPRDANPDTTEMPLAARKLGLGLSFLTASTDADLDAVFAAAVERRIDAVLISDQPFFTARHRRIVDLAARRTLPAVYGWREYVAAGGLVSYGSSLTDAWQQVGRYAGRILSGVKPADLPVMQASRFELVLNLKTARTLGLTVSPKRRVQHLRTASRARHRERHVVVRGVDDHGDSRQCGHHVLQQLQPLRLQLPSERGEPRDVRGWMRQTGHDAAVDSVADGAHHNGYRCGRLLRGASYRRILVTEGIRRRRFELAI